MTPQTEIGRRVLNTPDSDVYQIGSDLETMSDGFIYVPSIGLNVTEEPIFLGNFSNSQKKLHSNGLKELTLPEFKEFLIYTREHHPDIYSKTAEAGMPWRSEWIGYEFKKKMGEIAVEYYVFDESGKIVKKSEFLDENTLIEDRVHKDSTYRISFENWLRSSTNQGLPLKDSVMKREGNLFYFTPLGLGMEMNNSAIKFQASPKGILLGCDWNPLTKELDIGIRAAKMPER